LAQRKIIEDEIMGWFDAIKGAIFGTEAKAEEAPAATPAPQPTPSSKPVIAGMGAAPAPAAPVPAAPPASRTSPNLAPTAGAVDVAAVLDKAVAAKGQKLDWRKSIVDLLKAIDVDSSLTARKELAAELGYTGDTSDSAKMNIWLHKQVIQKLAANGGTVPADLLD
jgi:predicted secreted protein